MGRVERRANSHRHRMRTPLMRMVDGGCAVRSWANAVAPITSATMGVAGGNDFVDDFGGDFGGDCRGGG